MIRDLLRAAAGVLLAAVGCGTDDAAPADGGTDAGAVADPDPIWLRDAEGGVRILRGTNVAGEAKWAKDFLAPYDGADFVRLRDETGINSIRLLVFWEAIEPERGVYDDAYLAAVRAKVRAAGDAGLLVIVDMHQDVYGRGFGHAGAPRWACDEALYAAYEPPSQWFLGYFEPQVMECFDRFWSDPDTRSWFAAAWARLARELRDEPAVLAYDLINEPSWGSATTTRFEREIAPEVYADLAGAIRAEDPRDSVLVGIEPATTANIGLRSQLVAPDRRRLLYMPHMYPAGLELGDGYTSDPVDLRRHARNYLLDAARLGVPFAIGELGVRRDIPGADLYLRDAYDVLDDLRASAFQWDLGRGGPTSYGLWDESGAPALQARGIARPYPSRVAGIPTSWSWDAVAGVFVLEWSEDGSAAGDTLVPVPTLAFPSGADAVVDDGGPTSLEGTALHVPPRAEGGARRLTITRR